MCLELRALKKREIQNWQINFHAIENFLKRIPYSNVTTELYLIMTCTVEIIFISQLMVKAGFSGLIEKVYLIDKHLPQTSVS